MNPPPAEKLPPTNETVMNARLANVEKMNNLLNPQKGGQKIDKPMNDPYDNKVGVLAASNRQDVVLKGQEPIQKPAVTFGGSRKKFWKNTWRTRIRRRTRLSRGKVRSVVRLNYSRKSRSTR